MSLARRAALAACLFVSLPLGAQTTSVTSGQRAPRLVIRGATMVDGNGTPARGPVDIVIENGLIADVVTLDAVALRRGDARRPAGDVQIDATGKFVLPGLINAHTHMQSNRSGQSMGGFEYYLLLQLANGVTTLREVGAENELQSIKMRDQQTRGELVGPRMLIYPMFGNARIRTPADARARVQELKRIGADGIKILGLDRDIMQAMEDEAKKVGLPIAHHVGVEETNAWDDIAFGTRSIEHWYGIPDAAIPDGRQHFPSDYNYLDETDRFRWAGRLWREADPKILDSLLTAMVRANVAWVPTMDIYEASRDLQRAQTQPWFPDYLHPSLANYFKPDPSNHGSYFIGWSSTDEVYWKENYRIWMSALRDFERKGGLIGCGDDAGFIYQMYGYGLIREMELHAEAGFHPLKVIQHCTGNNAKILGMDDKIGRVRAGFAADLIIVDGNPLEDLKTLYPTHQIQLRAGREVRAGLEWTIAGGVPYHVPTVSARIKQIVDEAKGR